MSEAFSVTNEGREAPVGHRGLLARSVGTAFWDFPPTASLQGVGYFGLQVLQLEAADAGIHTCRKRKVRWRLGV